MRLSDRQKQHARNIAKLVLWLFENGYEATYGDAYRDQRSHGKYGEAGPYGARYSNHKLRCANDLNLFKDGVYLQETDDYREVGEKWESLSPYNRWGGRYSDGNHFETLDVHRVDAR